MADLRPELARRVTTPVMLGCYDGLGKKKNDRMFHINLAKRPPIVAWKKITDRKGKEMHMVDVRDGPAMPDAHQLFAMTDEDGSGFLSEAEVAGLYRRTMGENLRKKKLAEAMKIMDADGSGQVSPEEFAKWWTDNAGRALDQARARAFTLDLGEPGEPPLTKRLVAPDVQTKNMWVEACCSLLGKSLRPEPEPEPVPEAVPEPARPNRRSAPVRQPVRQPEPEPEPEPEPDPAARTARASKPEPQPEPQPTWAEKYSTQHQRWYWTHEGTGQASWLKEAVMTPEEVEVAELTRARQLGHTRHSHDHSHSHGAHDHGHGHSHSHGQVGSTPQLLQDFTLTPQQQHGQHGQHGQQQQLQPAAFDPTMALGSPQLPSMYSPHSPHSRYSGLQTAPRSSGPSFDDYFQARMGQSWHEFHQRRLASSNNSSAMTIDHSVAAGSVQQKVLADNKGQFAAPQIAWSDARMARAPPVNLYLLRGIYIRNG
jgi:hypothetical protein